MQKYKTIPLYEAENRRSSALPCAKEQLWRLQRPLWYRTHSFVLNCFRSTIFNYFCVQINDSIYEYSIQYERLQFLREEDGTINPAFRNIASSLLRKCESQFVTVTFSIILYPLVVSLNPQTLTKTVQKSEWKIERERHRRQIWWRRRRGTAVAVAAQRRSRIHGEMEKEGSLDVSRFLERVRGWGWFFSEK